MSWMPKYTITKNILSNLTKIEVVKNGFEDKRLSPVILSSLHKSAKVAQTHYSTQIEGNNLSFKQVETALYSGSKSANDYQGHDEKEVKDAIEAGARIIGVNNRDLRTFTVDITNSVRLRSLIPKEILLLCFVLSHGAMVKKN